MTSPQPAGPAGWAGTCFAVALLLAAFQACRRPANGDGTAESLGANRRHSPAAGECDAASGALVVTPFVREVSSGEEHPRVALAADGVVRCKGIIVGRISGACILDARGMVLRSVDANGIVYGVQRELAGVFQRRANWVDDNGKALSVDEVLVAADGSTIGITPEGSIYVVQSSGPALSMPIAVRGDVRRARRTALLLFDVGGELCP